MEAPQDYKTAGIFMLIAGITTTIPALIVVVTYGLLCFGLFWILPLVVGILEIVVGASVMGGQPKANAKLISSLGIAAAALSCNMVGLVLEILSVTYLGKPEVENYLTLQA